MYEMLNRDIYLKKLYLKKETHRSNHSTNQDPLQCDILQKKILELEAKIQNLELEKQIITKTPSISTRIIYKSTII